MPLSGLQSGLIIRILIDVFHLQFYNFQPRKWIPSCRLANFLVTFQPVSAHNLPSMREAFHVLLSLAVKSPAGKRDRKARDVLSLIVGN